MRSSAGHHRMINVSGHFRSLRCAKGPASVIIRGYLDASPPSPRQVRPRRSTKCIARPEDQRVRPFQVVPRRERAGNGDHRGETRPSATSATQRVWRGVTAWQHARQSDASWSDQSRSAQVRAGQSGSEQVRAGQSGGAGRHGKPAGRSYPTHQARHNETPSSQSNNSAATTPSRSAPSHRSAPSYRSRTTRPTAQSG